MKKGLAVFCIVLALLLFSSCRQEIYEPVETDPSTWEELFNAWWLEMNRNYVFFDSDSPDNEWDIVRETYLPRMREYGKLEGTPEETALKACRDFFDIVKNLSDGHYSLALSSILPSTSGYSSTVYFMPTDYRILKEYGYSDDMIFDFSVNRISKEDALTIYDLDYFWLEDANNIMRYTFQIDLYDQLRRPGDVFYVPYGPVSADGGKLSEYFKEAGYIVELSQSADFFCFLVGLTHDDILYTTFYGFHFYGASGARAELLSVLQNHFTQHQSDDHLKGLVIDLRGNGGGYALDLGTLWGFLIDEPLAYAKTRIKRDDNRLSYSAWHDLSLPGHADKPFDKPVAILINGASASASEVSTMAFMAMSEKNGFEFRTFGGKTAGATGFLNGMDQPFNAGEFAIPPYISSVATPGGQIVYKDGTSFEGIGIEPMQHADFNKKEMMNGIDNRLNAALAWMRERIR